MLSPILVCVALALTARAQQYASNFFVESVGGTMTPMPAGYAEALAPCVKNDLVKSSYATYTCEGPAQVRRRQYSDASCTVAATSDSVTVFTRGDLDEETNQNLFYCDETLPTAYVKLDVSLYTEANAGVANCESNQVVETTAYYATGNCIPNTASFVTIGGTVMTEYLKITCNSTSYTVSYHVDANCSDSTITKSASFTDACVAAEPITTDTQQLGVYTQFAACVTTITNRPTAAPASNPGDASAALGPPLHLAALAAFAALVAALPPMA